MQTISDDLRALLKSKLQIGDSGYGGYIRINGTNYPCDSITIDKSARMQAGQLTAVLSNEALDLGWGETNIFPTNTRVKATMWYGDRANAVQVFDGVIDNPIDHRDTIIMTLNARDRFAILIDQTFQASASQEVGEAGAVRTPDNGVYLNMEVEDIVNDILDRCGWPTADRDIATTSLVLTEFRLEDGTSYADNITGDNKLTTLSGFNAWSDEHGIFKFQPTPSSDIVEVPNVPVWTWRSGQDITELNDSTDQYELITRVKARGPVTTTTVTDSWHLLWQTNHVPAPVGIWYDPAFPSSIRVISSSTKRLYTVRDSDHQVVGSVYLGGVIPYPLGISGDPSDSTHYYVLNCPWKYTGSTSGNSVKKVRKTDNAVVATFSLPNGRWSALKISAAYAYLTNLDTDRFYRRDKTDFSSVANYQHVYNSVTQTNPSGMMIDGTTLMLFWANGGTTARFLHCEESAPTVITKVTKTSGSNLHGGEMNTTTHTECWGDNDSMGLTAKFSLVTTSTGTVDVAAEVIDTALEDELGANAELEDRVHDAHTGDPAHPWMSRRYNLDLSALDSAAQANDIAQFWLGKLGRRKRVIDAGIIGNPAVQQNDLVRIEDPVTGLAHNDVLDTIHLEMDERGFLGTVSLVRGGLANDAITEPDPPPEDPPATDAPAPSIAFRGCGYSLGGSLPITFDGDPDIGDIIVVATVWRDGVTDLTSVDTDPGGSFGHNYVAFTEIGRTTIHGNFNQEAVLAYRVVTSADKAAGGHNGTYSFGNGAGSGRPKGLGWSLRGVNPPDAHVSITNNSGAMTFPSLAISGDGIAIGMIGFGADTITSISWSPTTDQDYIENGDGFWQVVVGFNDTPAPGSVVYVPSATGGGGGDSTNSGTIAFFPAA